MNKKQLVIALTILAIVVTVTVASLRFGRGTTETTNQKLTSTATPRPATPPTPPSRPALDDFAINLPNALILVDSQGRRTGKDPVSGVEYHEIPGTTYFEEFHSGQLYFHSPAVGKYTLYILGGQTGEYHLDSWIDDGGVNHPHQVFSGNIQAGTMIAYTQNYDPLNISSSTPFFQGTASSTASITSEPPHNLPPPPVPGQK